MVPLSGLLCRRRRRGGPQGGSRCWPPPSASLLLPLLALLASGCQRPAQEVRVYSGRHYNTDTALYQRFQEQTGVRVRLLEAGDNTIMERLQREGARAQADVLILVDAARLAEASERGLLQPVRSRVLEQEVPAELRDPQGRWFALTRRVRAFVVNPALVNPASLRTYADLAAPALRGRLCLRNRANVYNQSLVADQLILRGEPAAAAWLRGMVANLAQPVFSSDTALARAVARGQCGVGLVNSYYVARMLGGTQGADDRALMAKVRIVYPIPAHVNVSGAGVTRHARNREGAIRLIEFLTSPSGSHGFAQGSYEYPLRGYGANP
ncbi:MAG: extracellular solute-binding protein, partial [Cyanobacteriota bacterium]|nr:extracellular solute-binding protein [Cyanobacteriota bacterium]